MLTRTLTLAACVFASTTAADAQQLLNPMTWFNPGYGQANCTTGNCPQTVGYRSPPNCANGFCATPAVNNYGYPPNNCPGGICPLPNQSNYGNYRPQPVQPAYPTVNRPLPSGNYYGAPSYYGTPSNAPYKALPYNTQNRHLPLHSVSAPRSMTPDNDPFYR